MNERLTQKIAKVERYLAIINRLQGACEDKFAIDDIYRGALLHYLYLMADTCIAVAEIVIRLRGLRPPQTYHEAFDILGEAGVLDAQFAYEFAGIAGFRNFLAHDYEDIQAKVICRQILDKLDDVEHFMRQIKNMTEL